MANTNKKRTHKDKAAAQFARTERNKKRQAVARARKAQARAGIALGRRMYKRLHRKVSDGKLTIWQAINRMREAGYDFAMP